MSIQFEDPPTEAAGSGQRETTKAQRERELMSHPGQWAKLYGTADVPATTRNTITRWEKTPGFETRRRVVESSRLNSDGSKAKPVKHRYELWVRYTGHLTPEQAAAVKHRERLELYGEGVPLDATGEPVDLPVASDPAFEPDVEPPINPITGQATDAEGVPLKPPAPPRTTVPEPWSPGMPTSFE